MSASLPPDEARRLQALGRYGVLDTPLEPAFERITAMARRLFQASIALISFLDLGRQWPKSASGVNLNPIARDVSFCTHTIRSDRVMVVPDARQDPRFAASPWVAGPPAIRFYAGAPLATPEGFRVGAVEIMDPAPREGLEEGQAALLTDLAAVVMDGLTWRSAASGTDRGTGSAGELRLKRMEALGKAAGRAGHDIKNLLTAILGHCDLALDQLGSQDPVRLNLEEISKAAARAAEVSRQLGVFSLWPFAARQPDRETEQEPA